MDIPNQVLDFFKRHAPFDALANDDLNELAAQANLVYVTAQNHQEVMPPSTDYVYLIQSGHFIVHEKGHSRPIGAGDYFGLHLLYEDDIPDFRMDVEEAGLIYFLPVTTIKRLQKTNPSIPRFFERYDKKTHSDPLDESSNIWLHQRIDTQLQRAPVTTTAHTSIEDCARLMTEQKISSLLITDENGLAGIITDKDIRSRVVAQGLPPSYPVSEIMTMDPHLTTGDKTMLDALSMMTQHNIHHLPIVKSNSEKGKRTVLGMVTSSDILRAQRSNILLVIDDISKANNLYELVNASWQIPHYFKTYASRFSDFDIAGKVLSQATDIMTRKLIDFFTSQHGMPPMDYCWMVYGSQARGDQNLGSDQDNALLMERDPSDEESQYFADFSDYVCSGLAKCGIKFCGGNIMASNPDLRKSISKAIERARVWSENPTSDAIMHFNIFLDVRCVSGNEQLFEEFIRSRTRLLQKSMFIASLARHANSVDVPLSLFRQFSYEKKAPSKDCINIKEKAVAIVNDIVRIYALAEGITAPSTVDRLNALTNSCGLNNKDRSNLKEIWFFLNRLRWRHQLTYNTTDNLVSMSELSSIERYQLKSAFQQIRQAQQGLIMKFSGGIAS
ncbi:CBS domain-containing protein [Paraneptunicella aestuarii]|uniref:putative nucleotidyltransferase substrate binding domain-containing protein n=1 Tax=Paraneptunicella aestuarii TaxID=2831148 RepID=UPI001E44DA56|nr:putative nucleotidyltransferase substrate binding domain-containing protein [Paraneptunicella aestuarii]UAA40025.1 CBS domain-containing protein [Paraneptunicella aestuarii]